MEEWENSVADVPPSNVFNYDETNLRDDPGQKKSLFRRGVRHAEKVVNTTKQCISIMFCGSAAGTLLPPMVVYKALHLYPKWVERGPKGCVYATTKSGWFDSCTFQLWFEKLFLPAIKNLPGKKVLVGDNLSSHINDEVISLCRRNNVAFVCLPAYATHIMQPLDVGVFSSLKAHWKTVLTEYKQANPRECSLNKCDFPGKSYTGTENL